MKTLPSGQNHVVDRKSTKYTEGQEVTIVHKTLGELPATIVSVLPMGLYLVSCEGNLIPVHERYISEGK